MEKTVVGGVEWALDVTGREKKRIGVYETGYDATNTDG